MRYKNDLYTPGRQTLGKPEIVGYKQDVAESWEALQARKREINNRLADVKTEQKQIKDSLGVWVAEGCDWKEYTDRLAELRAEAEALGAALVYLDNQAALLKRSNSWLQS